MIGSELLGQMKFKIMKAVGGEAKKNLSVTVLVMFVVAFIY